MTKILAVVSSILSVSLIVLFATVAVNHSSAAVPQGQRFMQADGIPLPPPPPPQGGGGKFIAWPDASEGEPPILVAFAGDGIPLPPPPPPQGGGGKFLES
jgi:hypothetical protein